MDDHAGAPLLLAAGTKVLTQPDGRVGVITVTPADSGGLYAVRFVDGAEQWFPRPALALFKDSRRGLPPAVEPAELFPYVVFRSIVGSTAYGLDREGSDLDRRGFYLPPADLEWSLAGVPEQLASDQEEVYWEIGKFVRLALKANPTVLECLYSPLIESCDPVASALLAERDIFLSRYVQQTFNAYVLSQFKKLGQDSENTGRVQWKHAMHLIRLLLTVLEALETGHLSLRVNAHRQPLLAIRDGEVPWTEVNRWRLDLHRRIDDAALRTSLPEHPDFRRADELLIQARRAAAAPEYRR